MKRFRASLLGLLLVTTAYAQGDSKGMSLFDEGMALFNNEQYAKAADKFEEAAERKYFRYTTPSFYFAGLSRYYADQPNKALQRFDALLKQYPETSYRDDAQYHRGLILLSRAGDEPGALYLLLNIAEKAADAELRRFAHNRVLKFFYRDASLDFLQDYYPRCRKTYRGYLVEAIAFRYYTTGEQAKARRWAEDYLNNYTEERPRLQQILGKGGQKSTTTRPEEIRVAVCVPLDTLNWKGELNTRTEIGLSFYTGIRTVLEHDSFPGFKKVALQLFNTQKSEDVTRELTEGALLAFAPHVVFGGVYPESADVLAEYAEEHGVALLVPFMPTLHRFRSAEHVFLASPSPETQVQKIARYLADSLKSRRVSVLSDGSRAAALLTDRFVQVVKDSFPSLEVKTDQVTSMYGIDELHARLMAYKPHAVYAPFLKTRTANYFLTKMYADSLPVDIIGHEAWADMENLDDALLSKLKVFYPSGLNLHNDTTGLARFDSLYYNQYSRYPSREALLGADLVRAALTAFGRSPDAPSVGAALRMAEPFRGYTQSFSFAHGTGNQEVCLLRHLGLRTYDLDKVAWQALFLVHWEEATGGLPPPQKW